MNKKGILCLILLFAFLELIKAQQADLYADSTQLQGNFSLIDDNYMVAALDSLSTLKYFENHESITNQLKDNKYNFLPEFIPSYSDSVYFSRIQLLDIASPIDLIYNPYVRKFIDLYACKKRALTERVLGLTRLYFPIFETLLDQYNIPLEMKYLAIVESALNPKARSRVGAGGLWQFMYYTGKIYGLEITSFIDDRNDPLKSTVAACRHFQDLYNIYHDWLLVLAAYNSGPGNVNKAIRRSGGKMTFWEIRNYLPRETRDYVPAFIAVNYVMAYSREHNIYPLMPTISYDETDTVAIRQPVTFDLLAEKLNISKEDIEFLNPIFRRNFVPATPATPCYLRLPKKSIADFINNEASLYAYFQMKGFDAEQFKSQDEYETITKQITHKVRKGETLATIARKYDCTSNEIKKWNKLKKSSVYKGQSLKILVQSQQPAIKAKAPKSTSLTGETASENDSLKQIQMAQSSATPTNVAEKARYHTIKKGENLAGIAKKYGVTIQNLMTWNHMKNQNLIAGKKLRVNNPVVLAQDDNSVASAAIPGKNSNSDAADVKARYHVVARGEYIGKIAASYGITNEDLIAWNDLKSNSLQIGQKLRVNAPQPAVSEKTIAAKEPDSTGSNKRMEYYTVKAGDTLWSISQKYEGVTIDQLKEWNMITDNSLKVGQQIKVLLPGN